jgi:hypothetical protein
MDNVAMTLKIKMTLLFYAAVTGRGQSTFIYPDPTKGFIERWLHLLGSNKAGNLHCNVGLIAL